MNEYNLLENLIENLKDENYQLNQEVQEMLANAHEHTNDINGNVMFNPYPTPKEAPMAIDENMLNALSSYNELPDNNQPLMAIAQELSTFDPISVSNGLIESTNVGVGMSKEEILTMIMASPELTTKFIENAPLGNACNGIDFEELNQNLLSMQKNSINNVNPMEASVESMLAEIQNNSVSLLESTYSEMDDSMITDPSMEELLSDGSNLVPKNEIDAFFPQALENVVSKINLHTMLHNGPSS